MVSRNSNNNTQSSVSSNSNNITPKNNEFAESLAHATKPKSEKAASPQRTKDQGRENTSLLFGSTAMQKPFEQCTSSCNSHYLQLHTACADDHTDVVQELIEKGADVNMKDEDGNTPLHIACLDSNTDIVQALLRQ